jgi:16S rRNA processing protein RimM
MYNLETDKNAYFCLGKVIKTHSYKGEIVILLDTDDPEAYSGLDTIFVDMDKSLVPWFVEKIRIMNDLATIKLEGITELEQAKIFLKKDVYLPIENLSEMGKNEFYFHEIIGFEVHDKQHGHIGRVEEILDRPEQEIIRILNGKNEILIPLTDEMISKIDRKKKILVLDTPEGLIDLYL